jgi:hypothetical protein
VVIVVAAEVTCRVPELCLGGELRSAGEAIRVELDKRARAQPSRGPVPCGVAREATAGSFSVIEHRARLGCMTPRTCTFARRRRHRVGSCARGVVRGPVGLVEAGQLIHLPADRDHAYPVASARARYHLLFTPAGFERYLQATGTALDQRSKVSFRCRDRCRRRRSPSWWLCSRHWASPPLAGHRSTRPTVSQGAHLSASAATFSAFRRMVARLCPRRQQVSAHRL